MLDGDTQRSGTRWFGSGRYGSRPLIAPRLRESKARERANGGKSCLRHDPEKVGTGFPTKDRGPDQSVHSLEVSLRGPIRPRKLLRLSACRTVVLPKWRAEPNARVTL